MDERTVAHPPTKRTPQSGEAFAFRRQARAVIQAAGASLLVDLEELLRQATPGPSIPQAEALGANGKLLLRVGAAARLLGISRARLYHLMKQPGFPTRVSLPGIETGTRYYRRSELEAWVVSLQPASSDEARP